MKYALTVVVIVDMPDHMNALEVADVVSMYINKDYHNREFQATNEHFGTYRNGVLIRVDPVTNNGRR